MQYEAVIGLEIHAELGTKSKMYCACNNSFGEIPNTNVCHICTGAPGTLPVLNKTALKYAVLAGLAFNCRINPLTRQYRKQYFYPDLPKGYQISQLATPLCEDGLVYFFSDNELKYIRIKQVHIEEDAGKLIHDADRGLTYIDYNRAGVPLIEIVTQPELHSAEDARAFVETVRNMLIYLGISDCNMQEGALRCDVNVSLRRRGEAALAPRVEIKNINTLTGVRRAVEYEIDRQVNIIKSGEAVGKETRRWNDEMKISVKLRSKEESHGYRYLPEPDLPPILIERRLIDELKSKLPEFEYLRRLRYINDLGISDYEAEVVSKNFGLSELFNECVALGSEPSECAKLLMGEVLRLENDTKTTVTESKLTPREICNVLSAVKARAISYNAAKELVEILYTKGGSTKALIERLELAQVSDTLSIMGFVRQALAENPKAVQDFLKGKANARTYIFGCCMKKSVGRANPKLLSRVLDDELNKRKAEF